MAEPPPELTLERFTRRLITTLADETVAEIGPERARAVVQRIGGEMSHEIEDYERARLGLGSGPLDPRALGRLLVDLKARIQGGFYLLSADDEKIVLGNSRCPFGKMVEGKPSLCMMTSSVFGGIAARSAGHARVDIEKAIARGDASCRVIVWLRPPPAPLGAWSNEYAAETRGDG